MPGIRALAATKLGLELTSGNAVSATRVWRGPVAMPEDAREVTFVDENVGYIGGGNRVITYKEQANISFPDTPATFEQLPLVLMCAIEDVTAGTADGTGSGYTYQYDYPSSAKQTIRTMTIEGGDDQRVDEVNYAFVTDFTLAGAAGGPVNLSSNWTGRTVTDAEFSTTGVTIPVVDELVFSKSYLYIDSTIGSLGSSVQSETVLGFNFNSRSGWIPVFTAAGEPYFEFAKYVGNEEPTLEITFEHDANAETEITAFRAETARAIRLDINGPALGTSGDGSTYTTKKVRIDAAGTWENFSVIGEQDGNDIVTGTFRMRYDSTMDFRGQIKVVNESETVID